MGSSIVTYKEFCKLPKYSKLKFWYDISFWFSIVSGLPLLVYFWSNGYIFFVLLSCVSIAVSLTSYFIDQIMSRVSAINQIAFNSLILVLIVLWIPNSDALSPLMLGMGCLVLGTMSAIGTTVWAHKLQENFESYSMLINDVDSSN